MKKLFSILSVAILLVACSSSSLTEEALIGAWEHPIEQYVNIEAEGIEKQEIVGYTYERFVFRNDGSFRFGEYGQNGPLYEVEGYWEINSKKNELIFKYDDGSSASIDIRNFTGTSFITTSRQGNDFKYVKL